MTTISIQIPLDAEAGDNLTFTWNNQEFNIEVPLGSKPGDVLEIQMGAESTSENSQKTEDNTTLVLMKTGRNIELHSHLPKDASVVDDGACDGTHNMVWPAAKALTCFINGSKFHELISEESIQSVLELGSGLGLTGLACGHILSTSPHQKKDVQVTLTDTPSAIPLLDYNVQQNRHLLTPCVAISTAALNWHEYPALKTYSALDLIMGSDLLYNPASIPALVATIKRLSSSNTRVLLAVRWRKPDLERSFFKALSDTIEWNVVGGNCALSWRDYGNPLSEASNVFFSQTMIAVQGRPIVLASIDESHSAKMTDDEFEAWERSQTQILLGRVFSSDSRTFAPLNRQNIQA